MFGFIGEEDCSAGGNHTINSTADSGYSSPHKRRSTRTGHKNTLLSQFNSHVITISPIKTEPVDEFSQSPVRQSMSMNEYIGLGDNDMEWEKDFFNNFEDNLFSLDPDNNLLDDFLRSPKGKEAVKGLMNSPKGKAIMSSPKGKIIKSRLKALEDKNVLIPINCNSYDASRKVGVTPMKHDAQKALKMSKRKLSMASPSTGASVVNLAGKSKTLWPSQQRLMYARNNFKITLEKAVKQAKERADEALRNQKKSKGKAEKCPQLCNALARPTVQHCSQTSKVRKISSSGRLLEKVPYNDDWMCYSDDENDEDWHGDLPFTGLKQAQTKRKKTTKKRKSTKQYY